MFVRGNVDVDNETFTQDEEDDDQDKQRFPKDAHIAQLYREHIYFPFNRKTKKWLGHNETYNVPDFMIAVAWQDGCDG